MAIPYRNSNEEPFYLQSDFVDPAANRNGRVSLNVRLLRSTERTLQALCTSEALTFWGHAAGMILDYFAANSTAADTEGLTPANAPAMLLRNGGSRRITPISKSRSVKLVLTPLARDWLGAQIAIANTSQSLPKYCALILHRNAALGADLVRAARLEDL